jgi:hypothetical protein
MKKKHISISINEEEYELLKLIAEMQYRTIKSLVEMVTREYVKTNRSQL